MDPHFSLKAFLGAVSEGDPLLEKESKGTDAQGEGKGYSEILPSSR